MLKLDNTLLDELGLGSLPDDQKRAMLQHIYETLELRVGTNLANQMSDQQLEEFEKFIDDGGDANQSQALQWLETNLPNYKQVVNEVFEALKGEISQMAPQLVAASTQQPQMPPQQAQPAVSQQGAPASYQPQAQPMPQQPTAPQAASTEYYQPAQSMPASAPQTPPAPQQDAQMYQFPQQQPPAGPSAPQQPQIPPQYPPQQTA